MKAKHLMCFVAGIVLAIVTTVSHPAQATTETCLPEYGAPSEDCMRSRGISAFLRFNLNFSSGEYSSQGGTLETFVIGDNGGVGRVVFSTMSAPSVRRGQIILPPEGSVKTVHPFQRASSNGVQGYPLYEVTRQWVGSDPTPDSATWEYASMLHRLGGSTTAACFGASEFLRLQRGIDNIHAHGGKVEALFVYSTRPADPS